MKPKKTTEIWNACVAESPAYLRVSNGEDERFWEQYADAYMRNRTSGRHYEIVTKWLLKKTRGASLIEIGPGPGVFTRFLAAHCSQVTAIEPSPANAAWLMREMSGCPNLTVARKKWEDAAVEPHDLVFSAGTLCMFPDIETAIAKMLHHARSQVLLVTMNDKQIFLKKIAAALGLPPPKPSGLSAIRFLEVLRSLSLSFDYESFSEEPVYLYPDIDVLLDLWKGSTIIGREHRSDLQALLKRQGLYSGNRTAIRVPKRFITYMVEITV